MSNPRIYMVIAAFHPLVGGAENQALQQSQNLRKKGYAATIITFHHDRAWLSNEEIEGVPVIRIAGTLLGSRAKLPRVLQKMFYLMALVVMGWRLWQHRHNYDILHVHQLNLLALPTAIICRLTGKPIIIVVHATAPDKAIKSYNHISLLAGPLDATTPWLQVHEGIRVGGDLEDLERLGKLGVQFTRSLLQSIHARVVIISQRMKSYLVTHDFDLPGLQLIPNGVDTTLFHPACADTFSNQQAQTVICVSRLCYVKGIDVLLQAWRLVHKQMPQARLIIVGIGPLQKQLEWMAKGLDIADSVEFAGMQSNIPVQLHRGSIAVLASRSEGMPIALLESMSCGLPCVATKVSGSEDLIQHGVNGLLVEPEDYRNMAQALLALLRDPVLIQQYGYAARATVAQHYSLEHITETYIDLYQKLASHK